MAWWHRIRRIISGGGRESASFVAALLGVLVLAGAALGQGISRTSVAVSDGLTWLGDDQRGAREHQHPQQCRDETRRLPPSTGDNASDPVPPRHTAPLPRPPGMLTLGYDNFGRRMVPGSPGQPTGRHQEA